MKSQELLNYEIAVIGLPLNPIEQQPEFSEKNYFQKLKSVMLLMGYHTSFGTKTYLFNYFTHCEINIGQDFFVVVNAVNDNKFIHQLSNICNYFGTNCFFHIKKETREISMIQTSQIDGEIKTIDNSLTNAKNVEIEYQNTSSVVLESFSSLQVSSKYLVFRYGNPILKELNILPFHK